MATVSFPTFSKKEILTAEKLNAFVQSLENKFTAGFSAADIQWPLVAQGNLNMGTGSSGYEILGGKKIFNVVNANSYSTFAAAVTAAGAGGCVFIPPDTTVTTDGATLVGSNVSVIGAGPSSVLKFTSSPTNGYMIRTDTGSADSFLIANLTLDGNINAGSNQHGIVLRRASQVSIIQVWFKDFSGDCVRVENDGTAGNKSTRIRIQGCFFSGGNGKHIFAHDVQDLLIADNVMWTCDEQAIYCVPDGASATLERVAILNNQIDDADNSSIYVTGSGAASSLRRDVLVQGNLITGQDADGAIVVGTSGNIITNGIVRDNVVQNQAGGTLVEVDIEKGQVKDNQLYDSPSHGIDLGVSKYLDVSGNHCVSCANVGVVAVSAATCLVHDNWVIECNTPLTYGSSVRKWDNSGDKYGANENGIYFNTGASTNGDTSYAAAYNWTIPGNALQIGDLLEVQLGIARNNNTDVGYAKLETDGSTALGIVTIDAVSDLRTIVTWRVLITSDSAATLWVETSEGDEGDDGVKISTSGSIDRTTDTILTVATSNAHTDDYLDPQFVQCRVVGHFNSDARA